MSTIINVEVRELRDLVYRCARIHGCSAGVAEVMSANVTFGELHYGDALEPFAVAMTKGDLPASPFATAPDVFAAAEAEARAEGSALADFASPVPLAALAQSLWFAAERGVSAVDAPFGATGSTAITELRLRHRPMDPERRETFEERGATAEQSGMVLSRMWFSVIEREAERFEGGRAPG